MSSAGDILRTATALVEGDRAEQNGDAVRTHANMARLWSAYLTSATGRDITIDPMDVANMMELFKIARRLNGRLNPDDFVDGAGYAALAYVCAQATD